MGKKKASSNALEVQNAAKTLFANIRFMSPDDPIRSIAITSSVPNEGKTTTAIELARAIASSGKKTLLVEADMRRRSLANVLGVRVQTGIYAVLAKAASLDQAVTPTSTRNLFLLDSEPNIPNPADILSSNSYARLASVLESSFDYVIYDTPPVGPFVDAAILSTLVDGVIMIVKPGMTKRAELLGAFEQLQKADAKIVGACATFCEGTSSEYYYAYYDAHGDRVKTSAQPVVQPGAQSAVRLAGQPGARSAVQPNVQLPAHLNAQSSVRDGQVSGAYTDGRKGRAR